MSVTTSIVLLKARKLISGKYPVKLRVGYYNGRDDYRRYRIVIDNQKVEMTEDFFNSVMSAKPRGEAKDWRIKLNAQEKRAREIIAELNPFTFDAFKARWNQSGNYQDAFTWYDEKERRLKKEDRHGSASTLINSRKSLQSILNRKTLPFSSITPALLERYEGRMLEQGKSLNTISVYLRELRAIINEAIKAGAIPEELTPFNRFEISTGSVKKKALTAIQIREFIKYQPEEYSTEDMAKDFFFLSYYWNGSNPADFFRIKYTDIQDGQIIIQREKVKKRRNYTAKDVVLEVSGFPKKVIEKWGQGGSGYIFPVINSRMSAKTMHSKIRTRNRLINKHLNRISKKLGFDGLSMNYARHSFATALAHAGVGVRLISEMMGHSDVKVTEIYMKGISKPQREEVKGALEEFKAEDESKPGTASDS